MEEPSEEKKERKRVSELAAKMKLLLVLQRKAEQIAVQKV